MIVPVDKIQRFKLADSFLDEFRDLQPKWGFGVLSYVTFKRTYARPLEDGTTEEWWQTCKRVIEGMFTVQKAHCKQIGVPWDNRKAQRSAQEAYRRMFDFKWLPPGRGLWMMGTDFVYERGGAALNNCFAYETEIITQDGIKTIGECVGTTQTILTTNGSWVDAPIRQFGKQKLWKITVSRQGVEKEIFATKDHRWFCIDRRQAYRNKGYQEFTTEELRPGVHRLQSVYGQNATTGNTKPSPFGIAHGFVFGDGTKTANNRHANTVVLCNEKDSFMANYFALCPHHESTGGFGSLPNFFKELPDISENSSYLLGWMMGYLAADGSCDKNGAIKISSSCRKNLEFVRDVCYKIGIGTYGIREETRISNLTDKPHTMYHVAFMGDMLTEDFFLNETHKSNYRNASYSKKPQWYVKSVEETDRLEFVGCATVDGHGKFALADNILTGNCGFTSTQNIDTDFAQPFCWQFEMSMLGVGVGFDTRGAGKLTIQEPRMDGVFVIEDSREGWKEALRAALMPFTGKGALPSDWDDSKVRKKGEIIQGFGGVASGPEPLIEMLTRVVDLLKANIGKKITSELIVDIMNLVGKCVVSGGVRRTAQISFGDPSDTEFIELKRDADKLADYRWASNNSIFATVGMDYSFAAESTAVNGEPGFAWLENMQAYGRMADPPTHKDHRVMGGNPCLEQSLEDNELCCLVETFPARHENLEDYIKTLKFAYLYAKTVTLIPTHDPMTNAVMMRNRRIGCSMSGIDQNIFRRGLRTHIDWCNAGYGYINELDQIYSEWLCVPLSIKKTSVKPSGTVSLLAGATPGVHAGYAQFMIRRIRVADTSPIWKKCQEAGYVVEDDFYTPNTKVIEFPTKYEFVDRTEKDLSIWEQVNRASLMQEFWADNQVSCTVKFAPQEAQDIPRILEMYEHKLKGISFLPYEDHGYVQTPYEEISQSEYEATLSRIGELDLTTLDTHEAEDKFCDGETCMISFDTDDQPTLDFGINL